jgi:hypothetical protein
MKDERRNWACVEVDSNIRDAQGGLWRVAAIAETVATEETTGAFRCVNAAGTWTDITPKPLEAPVTVSFPEVPEEQIALLRDALGASLVAVTDQETKVVHCARWPEVATGSLTDYRLHLELVHGMYATDIKGFKKLAEAHTMAHDDEHPHVGKHIPHTHGGL